MGAQFLRLQIPTGASLVLQQGQAVTLGREHIPVDDPDRLTMSRAQTLLTHHEDGTCTVQSVGLHPTLLQRNGEKILLFSPQKTPADLLPLGAIASAALLDGDVVGLRGDDSLPNHIIRVSLQSQNLASTPKSSTAVATPHAVPAPTAPRPRAAQPPCAARHFAAPSVPLQAGHLLLSVHYEVADVVDRVRRLVMLTSDFNDTPFLFEYPSSGIDGSWYTAGFRFRASSRHAGITHFAKAPIQSGTPSDLESPGR